MARGQGKITSVYLSQTAAARLLELSGMLGLSQSAVMNRLVCTSKVREVKTVSLENPELVLERAKGGELAVEDQ